MHVDLSAFTEDELVALNQRIVERLQMIRSARQLVQLSHFSIGLMVEFTTADGRTVSGRIVRLNRRTATVCSQAGGHWRVSPSLLRAMTGRAGVTRAPDVRPFEPHGT